MIHGVWLNPGWGCRGSAGHGRLLQRYGKWNHSCRFGHCPGRGDGLAMCIAGGVAEVQAQAQEYGLTPADVAEAARGTSAFFHQPAATFASALVNRGKPSSNKATTVRNPDALRLGEQIGLEVMGPERWKKYITTSAKQMNAADKPAPGPIAQQWASARLVDERNGWVFHHITMTAPRWTMTDQITYTLPGSTKENPLTHVQSLREAISEAYRLNWTRHSKAQNKDQKDKDAGMKLIRSSGKSNKKKWNEPWADCDCLSQTVTINIHKIGWRSHLKKEHIYIYIYRYIYWYI